MKILLSLIFDRVQGIEPIYEHLYRWLGANLKTADIKIFVCQKYFDMNQNKHLIDSLKPVLVSEQEIEYIFGKKQINVFEPGYSRIHNHGLSEQERQRLKDIAKKKLGDWRPDIIISQGSETCSNLWKNIFTGTLCLNQENAIFSRPPFNRTLSYDVYNAVPDNFLVRFADEIKAFKISKAEDKLVEDFKQALTAIIDRQSPLDEIMLIYKQKFDKLVLLPLVGDRYITLFNDCVCDNELNLVEYVMKNTPKNIGVFVTQADAYASLSSENIEYFSSKYSNFIFLQQTNVRGYANNSLNYFKYIDALLNITSKTGFMAMLWNKPVISLAKQYNRWYQDGDSIKDLERVLQQKYNRKNNVLYYYFTRYVLFLEDIEKRDFMDSYFEKLIEEYRSNGVTFGFYHQVNDIDKIFDYVINRLIQYDNIKQHISKTYVQFVRFMSHITFGRVQKYYKKKRKFIGMIK